MASYFILVIIPLLLSFYVSWKFKSVFDEYSKIPLENYLTGKEVAERMLAENNITDVKVVMTDSQLADNYNPGNKTISLSPNVYNSNSIAAAAVAAHECGHAVQHATKYTWLNFRSAIVPVVSISSRYVMWILLAGILLVNTLPWLLWLGIILFAATVIFSFITLPVEIDASKRALSWIKTSDTVAINQQSDAARALKWAAMTYVIAALASLGTLIYYIMIATNSRR
ncbi:MAG: zinc metallopeptidase [Solitalea-like symbiont of Acarus siro]